MNSLYFEKLSRFDRAAEPVTLSIPFAQGTLTDPAHLTIRDGLTPLPSLQRTVPTPHVLEALTYAHRISGDDRYLRVAANTFAALSAGQVGRVHDKKFYDASGALIVGEGGGRIFADKYTSLVLFAGAAAERGLLDWYEYPFG